MIKGVLWGNLLLLTSSPFVYFLLSSYLSVGQKEIGIVLTISTVEKFSMLLKIFKRLNAGHNCSVSAVQFIRRQKASYVKRRSHLQHFFCKAQQDKTKVSYFGRSNQQIYEVCFLDDLCIYKHLKLSPISEKYARKLYVTLSVQPANLIISGILVLIMCLVKLYPGNLMLIALNKLLFVVR